jgi:hypothetical protein
MSQEIRTMNIRSRTERPHICEFDRARRQQHMVRSNSSTTTTTTTRITKLIVLLSLLAVQLTLPQRQHSSVFVYAQSSYDNNYGYADDGSTNDDEYYNSNPSGAVSPPADNLYHNYAKRQEAKVGTTTGMDDGYDGDGGGGGGMMPNNQNGYDK